MESSENNFSHSLSHSQIMELGDGFCLNQKDKIVEEKTIRKFTTDNRSTIFDLQKRITKLEDKLLRLETKRAEVPKHLKKCRRKAK